MYFVYILQCGDGTLYTGITTDLKRREKEHQEGKGSRYTRSRKGGRLVYSERFKSRGAALRREAEIKKLSREEKYGLLTMSTPSIGA